MTTNLVTLTTHNRWILGHTLIYRLYPGETRPNVFDRFGIFSLRMRTLRPLKNIHYARTFDQAVARARELNP